ncbi:putative glyceraldehyde-3-phosphate dehydrogenase [Rosellinia necatrix]|uniref:glyceraldehyde-3-phosphate dehydrogenase (phosphorylating) n=1 Tax=Rosellinia necatrix TaxID=77044 RepID=A0A1S8AB53_ROSNE|nr:putative glyceraldehyde-3-phosphate dehydrogenase [Rosellinia necatrix]
MAPHDAPPKARIGINGFGRIGRVALRQSLRRRDVEVRAINHTCESAEDVMYLIRYDTTHGALGAGAGAGGADLEYVSEDAIRIGGREVALVSTRDASRLDWAALGVDYVLECTGRLTSTALAGRHVAASGSGGGALRVVVSAPSPDAPTFVYGVNSARYATAAAGTLPRVVSAASCTTNCVAPVLKVLHDALDITQAFFTTVHAATQSQHILDGYSRKSLRLGRFGEGGGGRV